MHAHACTCQVQSDCYTWMCLDVIDVGHQAILFAKNIPGRSTQDFFLFFFLCQHAKGGRVSYYCVATAPSIPELWLWGRGGASAEATDTAPQGHHHGTCILWCDPCTSVCVIQENVCVVSCGWVHVYISVCVCWNPPSSLVHGLYKIRSLAVCSPTLGGVPEAKLGYLVWTMDIRMTGIIGHTSTLHINCQK